MGDIVKARVGGVPRIVGGGRAIVEEGFWKEAVRIIEAWLLSLKSRVDIGKGGPIRFERLPMKRSSAAEG
jgi:hypothetical protein